MPKQVGVKTNSSAGGGVTGFVGTSMSRGPVGPSSMIVSGAGTSAANGTYTYRDQGNGKAHYNLTGQPTSLDFFTIVWIGTAWIITDGDGNSFYSSADDTEFPWQATFTIDGGIGDIGDPPAPVVTAS